MRGGYERPLSWVFDGMFCLPEGHGDSRTPSIQGLFVWEGGFFFCPLAGPFSHAPSFPSVLKDALALRGNDALLQPVRADIANDTPLDGGGGEPPPYSASLLSCGNPKLRFSRQPQASLLLCGPALDSRKTRGLQFVP